MQMQIECGRKLIEASVYLYIKARNIENDIRIKKYGCIATKLLEFQWQ